MGIVIKGIIHSPSYAHALFRITHIRLIGYGSFNFFIDIIKNKVSIIIFAITTNIGLRRNLI